MKILNKSVNNGQENVVSALEIDYNDIAQKCAQV